ncbi:Uu.00g094620.m01.CDS01 [Anthostomella pinea]|uniref:Uu.00g094620.m01.CDS01 n=1 Tax=Anthostomella pinea TaxID=933095 RepID=A0AAI8VPM3_9PEZI|nr:Uu.00g094620.m01.CDS01 [Anthostomella pinea]
MSTRYKRFWIRATVHGTQAHEKEASAVIKSTIQRSQRSPRKIFPLTQQHGDILLQDGPGMQRYYLYAIRHLQSLGRDSLTLRYITEARTAPSRKRKLEPIETHDG